MSAWMPAPPPESEPAMVRTRPFGLDLLWLKSNEYSLAARAGSASAITPEITATASAPAAMASKAPSGVMPPIATNGTRTALRTLRNVSSPTCWVTALVSVVKMLPMAI